MISVSGASDATGEAVASAASCAATDGGVGRFLSFLPVRRPRREPARSAASRPDEAYFSPGKAMLAAPRRVSGGNFTQHFNAGEAASDFAQGSDRGLVFAVQARGVALRQFTGAVRRGQRELETVGDLIQTVFDSDASH